MHWARSKPRKNDSLKLMTPLSMQNNWLTLWNRYVAALRTGEAAAIEELKSKAFAAIAHLSKSDRNKFAKEINTLINKLEKSPKALVAGSSSE